MRALVSGGCGLIGSHVVDLLLERGHAVRVIDSLAAPTHPRGEVPAWTRVADVDLRVDDVRDPAACARACEDVDTVFHLAAVGGFAPEPALMTDVNCTGTATLLEACRHAGVRRFVLSSSQAVYGHGAYLCRVHGRCGARRPSERLERGLWEPVCPETGHPLPPLPLRETDALRPVGPYSRSKLYAEQMALELGADWGMHVVALRYALTYGPRQSPSNPYTGICSGFAARMLSGRPVVLYEDGMQRRDFTYVGDVARANLYACLAPEAAGETYNVGTGRGTSVSMFAAKLAAALDVDPITELPGLYRPLDARDVVVDQGKLCALGAGCRTPLEDGLAAFADWFLRQPPPEPVDATAELLAAGVVRSRP